MHAAAALVKVESCGKPHRAALQKDNTMSYLQTITSHFISYILIRSVATFLFYYLFDLKC